MQGRRFAVFAAVLLAGFGSIETVSAQGRITAIKGADWVHPHTEFSFPDNLAGLERRAGTQFAEDFLDVAFSYSDEGRTNEVSVYLFRNTMGSPQIWLQQARRAIEIRDIYAQPTLAFPLSALAIGDVAEAGTLAVYTPGEGSEYASTAVAFLEINGWYVKLRASSRQQEPEALRRLVEAAVAELTWPAEGHFAGVVDEVQPCPEQLTFRRKSRNVRSDNANALGQALFGALLGTVDKDAAEEVTQTEAVTWCFDSLIEQAHGVYRSNASTNSYVLAIGDAGRGITVAPDSAGPLMEALGGKKRDKTHYQVKLSLPDRDIFHVLQDRLPSPARALELVDSGAVTSSVVTWGDDAKVEINTDAMN